MDRHQRKAKADGLVRQALKLAMINKMEPELKVVTAGWDAMLAEYITSPEKRAELLARASAADQPTERAAAIGRLCAWLDEHDNQFPEYADDVQITIDDWYFIFKWVDDQYPELELAAMETAVQKIAEKHGYYNL